MASSMTWEEGRDRLRKLREGQSRSSEEILEIWEYVLADFSYKLGDEIWMIYEQVCVAACDCGRLEILQTCIDALKAQFPGSLRVKKLYGLRFEAMGRYDKAEELYKSILEENETDSIIQKRRVALWKEQNDIPKAIEELNRYLKTYMSDFESWLELSELYMLEQDYAKAAYCMEELIMSNPHNNLYHQRYAEIKYTQGGSNDMEIARAYFSQALKLNPANMRALFGLFLSASNIAATKSNAKVKKDNMKYAAWAAEQINRKYKEVQGKEQSNPPSQLEAVTGMLDTLQITSSSSS